MIIEVGVLAAAAVLGGWLATRARNRMTALPTTGGAQPPDSPPQASVLEAWGLSIGQVIQVGDETRWPLSALVLHVDDEPCAALLLSSEGGVSHATLKLAPPDHGIYWLTRREVPMPPSPPSRIEVDGVLLDRQRLLNVGIEPAGEPPPPSAWSGAGLTAPPREGRFGLYRGSAGQVAAVLQSSGPAETHDVWFGRSIAPDEFDCLGEVGATENL